MNNRPEYTTINWKTAPSIKPRSHNTKYKVSLVFTNLSLSIFLRFGVNDTAFYHTSQTIMSYVRCPMNINGPVFQDISSAHSQVWESDGVWFLLERKWCTLDEFYLWNQVSKGRLCVFGPDKGWAPLWMWKLWPIDWLFCEAALWTFICHCVFTTIQILGGSR